MKYSCTSLHAFSMRYGGTLLGLFSVTWIAPERAGGREAWAGQGGGGVTKWGGRQARQ